MTGMLEYVAETAVGLAVFYGLFRLVLARDTHFQAGRAYLLASLLAAHLLPLLPVPSPFRQVVAPAMLPADVLPAVDAAARGGWPWARWALWVYAAGAAFVCVRLAWRLRHLHVMARQLPSVTRGDVRLVYLDEGGQPFSFWRTAFVPRPSPGEEQALEPVVAHERTHIHQRHTLDILLVNLATVGQWFNPFVWFYTRALRETHEYLADREVLAQGFDPLTYRHLLFEQHLGARSFELVHHLRESQIKRRLTMMTQRPGRRSLWKYLLALPALALLALVFAEPRVTTAEGSSTPQHRVSEPSSARQQADAALLAEQNRVQETVTLEMETLRREHAAAVDADQRQAIAKRMAKLQQQITDQIESVALVDSEAVERAIARTSRRLAEIGRERPETMSPEAQQKVQQEIETLAKQLQSLRARLVELERRHQ